MNQTPRTLNRILLLIGGLIFLGVGAATLAYLFLPAGEPIKQRVNTAVHAAFEGQSLGPTAVAVGTVVVIILLIAWIAAQGRGRTNELYSADVYRAHVDPSAHVDPGAHLGLGSVPSLSGPDASVGQVTFTERVAEQLLKPAMEEIPGVARAHVSAWIFKRQPCLKLTAVPATGVDPKRISADVTSLVEQLDAQLGLRVPVLVLVGKPRNSGTPGRVLD